ncbi:LURP-one-related family protein [Streptomyces sp. HNM0574]|uniref:LURP-one-related/scramblase family protein n=1 Tax=Streptomyces sp. HNM0574 TaxID=2714954 RepID=UPI00146DC5CA|nr:LURP-one-related family protein [Streptomyces sp. HNM0574]NLU68627.1 hypothetical protein [Streptomyces sp. HNM0574]
MRYLVRERLFAIGDDFWIEDENGASAFFVDGKALHLRQTFDLKDATGETVTVIRRRIFGWRPTMTVEHGGAVLATVRKKRLPLFGDRFTVSVTDVTTGLGTELTVRGNVLDKEYDIQRSDGETLARISRKWFRLRDTYAVEIEGREGPGVPLLLSVAVCVDVLERLGSRRPMIGGGE